MFNVSCEELGVIDCEYQASGEIPGDVLKEMITHLETTHDMDMPDAEDILKNPENPGDAVLIFPKLWLETHSQKDESVRLISERLVNKLNLPIDPYREI